MTPNYPARPRKDQRDYRRRIRRVVVDTLRDEQFEEHCRTQTAEETTERLNALKSAGGFTNRIADEALHRLNERATVTKMETSAAEPRGISANRTNAVEDMAEVISVEPRETYDLDIEDQDILIEPEPDDQDAAEAGGTTGDDIVTYPRAAQLIMEILLTHSHALETSSVATATTEAKVRCPLCETYETLTEDDRVHF